MVDYEALEAILDGDTLAGVIAALGGIANDKAEHILSAWQDASAARSWERDAAKLVRLSVKLEN